MLSQATCPCIYTHKRMTALSCRCVCVCSHSLCKGDNNFSISFSLFFLFFYYSSLDILFTFSLNCIRFCASFPAPLHCFSPQNNEIKFNFFLTNFLLLLYILLSCIYCVVGLVAFVLVVVVYAHQLVL